MIDIIILVFLSYYLLVSYFSNTNLIYSYLIYILNIRRYNK